MEFIRCALCLNKFTPKEKIKEQADKDDAVKNQLQVIFLLRKVLEIPVDKCCDFLQDYGDPCSWVNSCDSCSKLIEKGRKIFNQIMILQNQFEKLQEEMKMLVIRSAKEDNSEWGVIKTVRSFVCKEFCDSTNEPIQPIKEEFVEDISYLDTNVNAAEDAFNFPINSECLEFVQHPSITNVSNDLLIYQPNNLVCKVENCHAEENDPFNVYEIDHTVLNIKEETQSMPKELNLQSNTNLRSHLSETLEYMEHSEEKTYKCDTCGRCFPKASNLKNHEKVHFSRDGRYQCQFCKKWFSNAYAWRRHINTHTLEKQFTCSFCGKCCAEAGNLQKHLRIHTGEKPYECRICRKSFTSSTYRKKHEKAHSRNTVIIGP